MTQLAVAFIRASCIVHVYHFASWYKTLLEFPAIKVRKSLVFACENTLHF